MMGMRHIDLDSINMNGETQSRVKQDRDVTKEYAEEMQAGKEFQAITLFFDGANYLIGDGYHRVAAARLAGVDSILADVRNGTRRDALLFSVGANVDHGLRRTNADKRKAVGRLLNDSEWSEWSNRDIAKVCSVSPGLVDEMRLEGLPTVGTPALPKGSFGFTDLPQAQPVDPPKPDDAPGEPVPFPIEVKAKVRRKPRGLDISCDGFKERLDQKDQEIRDLKAQIEDLEHQVEALQAENEALTEEYSSTVMDAEV